MKKLLLVLMALSFAGCTFGPTFPYLDQLKEELGTLKGQPISEAVKRLGKPDSERENGDNKVYIWTALSTFQTLGVDNECIGDMHQEKVTVYGTYTSGESDEDQTEGTCRVKYRINRSRCRVKIFVGKDEKIVVSNFEGGTEACEVLGKRIDLSYSFSP